MQGMLDICSATLSELDLCFNVTKSSAMRIGPRCWKPCHPLSLDNKPLKFVDSTKYLGVHILQGRYWRTDISHCRASFYRAFNAILSKTKLAVSELTSVHLMNSICRPITTFAIEACSLTRTQLNELDGMLDNCIRRIFGVQTTVCISYIRGIFNIAPTELTCLSAKCKLLQTINCNSSPTFKCVFRLAFNESTPVITANDIDLSLPAIVQIRHLTSRCQRAGKTN
jgi:hypothetical protein